jgi:hypothetical protein
MKFRNLIAAAAVAALPLTTYAATLIVPVAGTGPGANASQWRSELTLHTVAPRPVTLALTFHYEGTIRGPVSITLQPRETLSIADVVRTKFGVTSGNGALLVDATDRDARTLAVTSRISNVSPTGEFGQDIPSVDAEDALRAGDIAAISGPSSVATNRFNFGIYATEKANIEWRVVRANGTVAATSTVPYEAGIHVQYNSGVQNLFNTSPQDNDTVQARIISGRAVFYGSIINVTGDPTFVPGIRTREDILIQLAGVDLDENGSIDLRDANGDAVLDAPVQIIRSGFGNYFRVVAVGEFGEPVTLEVVSSPGHARFLDANGTLLVTAGADVTGTTGAIVLKATSNGATQLITIPVTLY